MYLLSGSAHIPDETNSQCKEGKEILERLTRLHAAGREDYDVSKARPCELPSK